MKHAGLPELYELRGKVREGPKPLITKLTKDTHPDAVLIELYAAEYLIKTQTANVDPWWIFEPIPRHVNKESYVAFQLG